MRVIASKLHRHIRSLLCYKRDDSVLGLCRSAEISLAGRSMFKLSREIEVQRQVLIQSSVSDHGHDSELQQIFTTYCSYGQKGHDIRLGVGAFLRLMRDSKRVMLPSSNGLSPSDVELIFMKHRSRINHLTVDSHLRYVEFLAAIEDLAKIFLLAPALPGGFIDADAKKCTFLRRHVFQSKMAKLHTESLCSSSCVGRADSRIRALVQKITSLWRIYHSYDLLDLRRYHCVLNQREIRRNVAMTAIQRVWRGATSRQIASSLAQSTYELFVDSSSGRKFWYNRLTRQSRWTRPAMLAQCEAKNPIFMPCSELAFETICALCSQTLVESYCIDCKQLLCAKCHLDSHRHNNQPHHSVEIKFCVYCHFQPGADYKVDAPQKKMQVPKFVNNVTIAFVTPVLKISTLRAHYRRTRTMNW